MTETTSLADEAARLFTEYRSGRRDSLGRLVHLLTPTLWHLARSCGASRSDAEDVVQTAWLRLADNADSVRDPQAVLAWLGTTVRRETWRVCREAGRDITLPEHREVVDPSPEPSEAIGLRESQSALWRHFQKLSPRCQALLRVISRGGPPDYAALAESLDMPVGSIGPTRGRCLAALRKALTSDPTWSRT